jgi:hypothetical protein
MIPLNNAKERLQGTMEMENDRGITAMIPTVFIVSGTVWLAVIRYENNMTMG